MQSSTSTPQDQRLSVSSDSGSDLEGIGNPDEISDPEELERLIAKCRKSLAQKYVRDVEVDDDPDVDCGSFRAQTNSNSTGRSDNKAENDEGVGSGGGANVDEEQGADEKSSDPESGADDEAEEDEAPRPGRSRKVSVMLAIPSALAYHV